MQSYKGQWWKEFRGLCEAMNIHPYDREAERAIVERRKNGATPLGTISELRRAGVLRAA